MKSRVYFKCGCCQLKQTMSAAEYIKQSTIISRVYSDCAKKSTFIKTQCQWSCTQTGNSRGACTGEVGEEFESLSFFQTEKVFVGCRS
jgi:hypothetical protein